MFFFSSGELYASCIFYLSSELVDMFASGHNGVWSFGDDLSTRMLVCWDTSLLDYLSTRILTDVLLSSG